MAAPRSKSAQNPDGGAPDDPATPVPDQPAAAAPGDVVRLGLRPPHTDFVPGGGLAPVRHDGTDYAPGDADRVRALARRYDVPLYEITPEPPALGDPADDPTAKEL